MGRWHLWLLLLAAGPLAALPTEDPLPTPADLPPTAVAIGLLRQDPAVQEALANVSGASHSLNAISGPTVIPQPCSAYANSKADNDTARRNVQTQRHVNHTAAKTAITLPK